MTLVAGLIVILDRKPHTGRNLGYCVCGVPSRIDFGQSSQRKFCGVF